MYQRHLQHQVYTVCIYIVQPLLPPARFVTTFLRVLLLSTSVGQDNGIELLAGELGAPPIEGGGNSHALFLLSLYDKPVCHKYRNNIMKEDDAVSFLFLCSL